MIKQDTLEKLKNKKIILGSATIVSVVAVVFVISLFPFIINPEKIFTLDWWTDELILVILTIVSVVCVMIIGQAINAQDARSNLAQAKVNFRFQKDKIDSNVFTQWVKQILEPENQEAVYKRILDSAHLEQDKVLSLSKSDLKSLIDHPQRIDNCWFDELSLKQYKLILKIKKGDYNITFVNPDYYLNDKMIGALLTESERATGEAKKHAWSLGSSLLFKIIMLILVGAVVGMFTKDMASVQDISTSLMKLFSRLSVIMGGSFSGFLTGCKDNDISAIYIQMKADIMKRQMEDTSFKAKSIEEIAKEKFELRVKLENEKYMKQLANSGETLKLNQNKE